MNMNISCIMTQSKRPRSSYIYSTPGPPDALHGPPRSPRGRGHLHILAFHLLLELLLQLLGALLREEELLLEETKARRDVGTDRLYI